MKYVIYTRFSPKHSKKKDKEEGKEEENTKESEVFSTTYQIAECMKVVGNSEYVVFSDKDISGDTHLEKCPQLKAAIESLKKGDIFIVWKMDRLSRDILKMVKILSKIEKKGATCQSVVEPNFFDDNPSAELMRTMLVAFSKYELEGIRLRVRTAARTKKERGERVGHIPYGYQLAKENKLVADEQEQQRVNLIAELYSSGRHTYQTIADCLNSKGLLNRGERPWSRSSAYRILKNRDSHAVAYLPKQLQSPQQ